MCGSHGSMVEHWSSEPKVVSSSLTGSKYFVSLHRRRAPDSFLICRVARRRPVSSNNSLESFRKEKLYGGN